MTRAEAEAALAAAEQEHENARARTVAAQDNERSTAVAVAAARRTLRAVNEAEAHAARPNPVWLVAPAPWLADRRIAEVTPDVILLAPASGGGVSYSPTTGFVRYARGRAKESGGRLDVPATLAVWAARADKLRIVKP